MHTKRVCALVYSPEPITETYAALPGQLSCGSTLLPYSSTRFHRYWLVFGKPS